MIGDVDQLTHKQTDTSFDNTNWMFISQKQRRLVGFEQCLNMPLLSSNLSAV